LPNGPRASPEHVDILLPGEEELVEADPFVPTGLEEAQEDQIVGKTGLGQNAGSSHFKLYRR
jgi:hypothetical protein